MCGTEDSLHLCRAPLLQYECLHANQGYERITPLESSQSEGQVSLSQSRSLRVCKARAQLMAFTSDLFFCRRSPTVLEARIETII